MAQEWRTKKKTQKKFEWPSLTLFHSISLSIFESLAFRSKNELKNGLSDWGLDLNYSEIDALFTFFDRDNSGTISFDEFVKGMRGPMSDRRKNLVQLAFKVVDKTGDGQVTVEDLKGVYDCSQHEGVVAGDISEEEGK